MSGTPSRGLDRRGPEAGARRRAGAAALLAIVLALALAACSGVPSSSRPETIRPVTGDSPSSGSVDQGPAAGADARSIVNGFLSAAASSSDAHHSGARQYLTTDAGSRWQDNTVTILQDSPPVAQNPVDRGDEQAVDVTGQLSGKLDSTGVYTPALVDTAVTRTFLVKRENNASRINTLDPGVLIGASTFNADYGTQPLYFLNKDPAQPRLVADLRYSALRGQELGEWLLAQLIAGPQPNLLPSVTSALPLPDVTRKASVTVTDQLVALDIPGAAQLDPTQLRKLAAQLAYTFNSVTAFPRVSLSDAGKAIDVPGVGATFSRGDFGSFDPDVAAASVPPKLYYVRAGGLVDGVTNKPVTGPVGNGSYKLTSVALRIAAANGLRVAALSSAGLLIGDSGGPLSAVTLPVGQPLSRPEFRPQTNEVWIGVGSNIYRVRAGDRAGRLVPVTGQLGGQISALRFSPDGARVGIVLKAGNGHAALWSGAVVVSGSSVTVGALTQITPNDLNVTDLAWSDPTHLLFIGAQGSAAPQVWTVQCDGYSLNSLPSTGLTRGLLAIAAVPNEPPVVVTDGPAIWEQVGGGWEQPAGSEASTGAAPAYAS